MGAVGRVSGVCPPPTSTDIHSAPHPPHPQGPLFSSWRGSLALPSSQGLGVVVGVWGGGEGGTWHGHGVGGMGIEGQCGRDGDEKDGGRDRHRRTRMEGYGRRDGCCRRAGAGGVGQAGAGGLGKKNGAGRQGQEDRTGAQEQTRGAGALGWVCRGSWEPPPGVGDAERAGSLRLRCR